MTYHFEIPDEDAVRRNLWLRMAILGPSGAGKTLGALTVASNLMGGGLPVVGVDTERERMLIYAPGSKKAVEEGYDGPTFAFKHFPLVGDYAPEAFIAVIDAAERKYRGGVLIVDSFSHEWVGTGGILQLADRFGQWKDVRPRHTAVIDRLMSVDMHVICCIRAKMKYEVTEEEKQGQSGTRQVITKLGIGPIQDDAIIYEFDVVADVEARSHEATFSNRCGPLVDTVRLIDAEVAGILTTWLSEGDPPEPPPAASESDVAALRASLLSEGTIAGKAVTEEMIEERFGIARTQNRGVLHPDYVTEQLAKSRERLAVKPGPAADAPAAASPPAGAPPAAAKAEPVAVPDGDPSDAWTVVQLDLYAAREELAADEYPAVGNKAAKLAALNAWLEALAASMADPAAEEDIPFGEPAAGGQEALV